MIFENIKDQQSAILEKVYENRKPKRSKKISGMLKTILEANPEDVSSAFGSFGLRILGFLSSIDKLNPHPELFDLFEGDFISSKQGSFGKLASDILKMHNFAKENKISSDVLKHLSNFICTNKNYVNINMLIDDPQKNLLHVRFVNSRAKRDKIRTSKLLQMFELENIECDDDFSRYYRGNCFFEEQIKDAQNRFKHFNDLGLKIMSKEISGSIKELIEESKKSQTCGFNKIKLREVAAILAKQSSKIYDINKTIRVHTHICLKDYISPETCDIINRLENFPEIKGHPLFDHYRIAFFRKYDCNITDYNLIKNKEVISVLLGEKDGDFYFICYA